MAYQTAAKLYGVLAFLRETDLYLVLFLQRNDLDLYRERTFHWEIHKSFSYDGSVVVLSVRSEAPS